MRFQVYKCINKTPSLVILLSVKYNQSCTFSWLFYVIMTVFCAYRYVSVRMHVRVYNLETARLMSILSITTVTFTVSLITRTISFVKLNCSTHSSDWYVCSYSTITTTIPPVKWHTHYTLYTFQLIFPYVLKNEEHFYKKEEGEEPKP